MYSRQEAAQLRQEFWTVFGQYLLPIPSAEGQKINWVNYKTGEKNIHFKMEAQQDSAWIGIEISHKDYSTQRLYFEQFTKLKSLLHKSVGENWQWSFQENDSTRRTISLISKTLIGKSIMNKNDWPELISFFKPRILALDEFWSNARYAFELLH